MSDDEITIPARDMKEAQFGHNDVWPGDLVKVKVSQLALEGARAAAQDLNRKLEVAMLAAFEAGLDFAVGPTEVETIDPFTPLPLASVRMCYSVKAGPVLPDESGKYNIPPDWRVYHLKDWQESKP